MARKNSGQLQFIVSFVHYLVVGSSRHADRRVVVVFWCGSHLGPNAAWSSCSIEWLVARGMVAIDVNDSAGPLVADSFSADLCNIPGGKFVGDSINGGAVAVHSATNRD